jgi:DNA polymerase-3 subunit delta'
MRAGDLLCVEAPIELLSRALAGDRLPHALLFQGPEGIGKGRTALALAAALLCERERAADRPCGACAACRKVEHGNHPDFMLVERLPKKAGASEADAEDAEADAEGGGRRDLRPFIVVDQIREVIARAAYAPREGRSRVFVVDPGDRMNAEAQSALLKTLE